jgi:hypothetical protein
MWAEAASGTDARKPKMKTRPRQNWVDRTPAGQENLYARTETETSPHREQQKREPHWALRISLAHDRGKKQNQIGWKTSPQSAWRQQENHEHRKNGSRVEAWTAQNKIQKETIFLLQSNKIHTTTKVITLPTSFDY